jgi:hypothetical protein
MPKRFVWKVVLVLALVLVGLPDLPASAHSGDGLTQPIFEQMSPTAPGITVQVAYSANYQFLVSNTGQEVITFLADSGEPFLQIGPDGVRGNFASPTFYSSNSPEGLQQFPDQAKPGPDVPPIWRKLSVQPTWGWYDHRLHPAESSVPAEIQKANKVAVLGRWTVPFRLGDQPGELQGRFEFRPATGSYAAVQKSSLTPAQGVKIQVVSARTVPAFFVENRSPEPVVILGRDNEPFARIGPRITEVNVKSPIWVEVQQALGKDPSDEADVTAEPKWQRVADQPVWQWLEVRAAAPKSDPPKQIVEGDRATTVKTWSIPYLIGDRKGAVEGITEFVPIARLRQQAAGQRESDGGSKLPLYAGIGLALAALAAAGRFLWIKKIEAK